MKTSKDGTILINYFHLKFKPLKQLSKVCVWYHSQEYLFQKLSGNYHPCIGARVYFSKIPCFQHILLNIFRRIHLNYQN